MLVEQQRKYPVRKQSAIGLDLDLTAVGADPFQNGLDMRVKKWIALAVELNCDEQRKQSLCYRLERLKLHVPAANSSVLLATADFTPQITFVRKTDITAERWWNLATTMAEEVFPAGMQLPMPNSLLALRSNDAPNSS